MPQPAPNNAPQSTRLRVTALASATAFPSTMQVPRRSGVWLNLGALGAMRRFLILIAAFFNFVAFCEGGPKGPESPERQAEFQAMYSRDVEPILARIDKSLSSRSVPELFAMLAEDRPLSDNAIQGSYTDFLPAAPSGTLYYLVCRDANRLVFKELSKRVALDRPAIQKYADHIQRNRSIFTGSGGPPLSIQWLCEDLLEKGKYP